MREGLDLPEVSLVVILDADKEGFLRSETALIQTCGRASRNIRGRVILYADKQTAAIRNTIAITQERRERQEAYNQEHNITPRSTKREQTQSLEATFGLAETPPISLAAPAIDTQNLEAKIKACEAAMRLASKELRFEDAAAARDLMRYYQKLEMI